MNVDKQKFLRRITTGGLIFSGEITERAKRMTDKIIYSASIEVKRELGRIEGYFQISIWGIYRHFDSLDEARDFLVPVLTTIEQGKFKLIFEPDRYHADDSRFHLFVEGVNDEEEKELMAELKEEERERHEPW
tara:strand:- start:825 stop:1223 length:399 start_codon:yes stop_codon:yes gene_type:complete